MFARYPIITLHEGQPTLIMRVAIKRHNFLIDAHAKAWVMISDPLGAPQPGRRFCRVALLRDENPLLALSWLIYHVIDQHSPLYGMNSEDLRVRDVNLAYVISGYDEDYAQEVRARHLYYHEDIRWNHVYVDTVIEASPGLVRVDFSKLHETRPQEP